MEKLVIVADRAAGPAVPPYPKQLRTPVGTCTRQNIKHTKQMKTSLTNETGVDRAGYALLGTAAAAVLAKLKNLRTGSRPAKSGKRKPAGRRPKAPRSQRAALVKGGVRHG